MVFRKCLYDEWTAVREKYTYYFRKLVFVEGSTDFCYPVPTLRNPRIYIKQG